ncbi:MAG TPA: hypothetical protein VFE14_04150 [Micromonosporaceae bacterium]|nr:hypothetical protein [Micromonosporaceae bacterium]
MPTVEEIKASLAASVGETDQATHAIRGVIDRLDDALARLRLTAAGTVHPALTDAIARLEQAKVRLDEARTLARAAIDAANTYRSTM